MESRNPTQNTGSHDLRFNIEIEREEDGRWIAEIPECPGVLAYGSTEPEARAHAYALALRVLADRIEISQDVPASVSVVCAAP